ncbi:MAG TPA: DUF3105 domain-containing protein [Kineosporiaceae bacterium]|nr:DUF3105 domain-containing protein [Kineosporiaceae bacterium]
MGKQTARDADRKARVEAIRRQQQRADRRRTTIWVSATAALVVLLAGAVAWVILTGRNAPSQALTGLVTYANLSRDHVEGTVTYAQTPPAGGKHSAVWQNCGVYTSPIANEAAVHSLEHGATWITYRPDLPADQVKVLQDDVRGQPYGLLSPYPGLPDAVVATAWGTQLKLSSATDPRLKLFITTYGDGMKAPEPGGECTGGTGTPQP